MQFQAWMAITFAVIVASFSAGDRLGNNLRIIVAIVYLMAAYALFARWITEATRLAQIVPVLSGRGIETFPVMFSGQTRLATYVIGTLIATISIFYFGSFFKSKEIGSNDSDT